MEKKDYQRVKESSIIWQENLSQKAWKKWILKESSVIWPKKNYFKKHGNNPYRIHIKVC